LRELPDRDNVGGNRLKCVGHDDGVGVSIEGGCGVFYTMVLLDDGLDEK
jgi:hypothetical protein